MVVPVGTDTSPDVGFCSPQRILSIVDFPAPFFPTKAMRSLSLMTNETFVNNGFAENSTVKLSIETMFVLNIMQSYEKRFV